MNKLFITASILISVFISTFAIGAEKQALDVQTVNDIVGAIQYTEEAKTFSQFVKFDDVTYTRAQNNADSVIVATGTLIIGGEMNCGILKLKIERTYKTNGPGRHSSATAYKATLDKTELSPAPVCNVLSKEI